MNSKKGLFIDSVALPTLNPSDNIPIPQSESIQQEFIEGSDRHFKKAFQVVPFQYPPAGVLRNS